MKSVFQLDGKTYNVHVTSLTRKFSVLDNDTTKRVQTGDLYRDIIGTFYNYEMTIFAESADQSDLNELWETLSQPVEYHICTFPYNNTVLTQKMYITSGDQALTRMTEDRNVWGEIKLSFIANSPGVRA